MVICPSKALIDAVWTMTPRCAVAVGSLVANAAADRRARLNGPHTWSSRLATSTSPSTATEPSRADAAAWLGMTTPVALTAIENVPSSCG